MLALAVLVLVSLRPLVYLSAKRSLLGFASKYSCQLEFGQDRDFENLFGLQNIKFSECQGSIRDLSLGKINLSISPSGLLGKGPLFEAKVMNAHVFLGKKSKDSTPNVVLKKISPIARLFTVKIQNAYVQVERSNKIFEAGHLELAFKYRHGSYNLAFALRYGNLCIENYCTNFDGDSVVDLSNGATGINAEFQTSIYAHGLDVLWQGQIENLFTTKASLKSDLSLVVAKDSLALYEKNPQVPRGALLLNTSANWSKKNGLSADGTFSLKNIESRGFSSPMIDSRFTSDGRQIILSNAKAVIAGEHLPFEAAIDLDSHEYQIGADFKNISLYKFLSDFKINRSHVDLSINGSVIGGGSLDKKIKFFGDANIVVEKLIVKNGSAREKVHDKILESQSAIKINTKIYVDHRKIYFINALLNDQFSRGNVSAEIFVGKYQGLDIRYDFLTLSFQSIKNQIGSLKVSGGGPSNGTIIGPYSDLKVEASAEAKNIQVNNWAIDRLKTDVYYAKEVLSTKNARGFFGQSSFLLDLKLSFLDNLSANGKIKSDNLFLQDFLTRHPMFSKLGSIDGFLLFDLDFGLIFDAKSFTILTSKVKGRAKNISYRDKILFRDLFFESIDRELFVSSMGKNGKDLEAIIVFDEKLQAKELSLHINGHRPKIWPNPYMAPEINFFGNLSLGPKLVGNGMGSMRFFHDDKEEKTLNMKFSCNDNGAQIFFTGQNNKGHLKFSKKNSESRMAGNINLNKFPPFSFGLAEGEIFKDFLISGDFDILASSKNNRPYTVNFLGSDVSAQFIGENYFLSDKTEGEISDGNLIINSVVIESADKKLRAKLAVMMNRDFMQIRTELVTEASILRNLIPSNEPVGGNIAMNAEWFGSYHNLKALGDVKLRNGAFYFEPLKTYLRNINADIELDLDDLLINNFWFDLDQQKITISGGVNNFLKNEAFVDLSTTIPRLNLALSTVPVLSLSADLQLIGELKNPSVRGDILIEEAIFAPDFFNKSRSRLNMRPQAFNFHADLNIDFGKNAKLNTSILDADIQGTINIAGNLTDPLFSGDLSLKRGQLHAFEQDFDFDTAKLFLAHQKIGDAYLDLEAEGRFEDYAIYAGALGPIDDLSISLSSSPSLSNEEILKWLAFGDPFADDRSIAQNASNLSLMALSRALNIDKKINDGLLSFNDEQGFGINRLSLVSRDNDAIDNFLPRLKFDLQISQKINVKMLTELYGFGSSGRSQEIIVEQKLSKGLGLRFKFVPAYDHRDGDAGADLWYRIEF